MSNGQLYSLTHAISIITYTVWLYANLQSVTTLTGINEYSEY